MQQSSSTWIEELSDHPIFNSPDHIGDVLSLDLANKVLSGNDSLGGGKASASLSVASSRRSDKMCFRGSDVIVAVGSELRIATLALDTQTSGASRQYKTLYTPNAQFEIQQMSLAPGGKMLAIAGVHQVAVVVLPRPSYHKLLNTRVDCKAIQVGQYYHATAGSSRVARIDWHPWNEAGTSLLVLTADGTFREYDISRDTEEPQQTLSFLPPSQKGQYSDVDPAAREAVSFTFGKGNADWSPLSVYSVMRNGDIYGLCPFLPTNASVPSTYVHSLEFFVAAKRELIERGMSSFIPLHHSIESDSSALGPQGDEEIAIMNDQQLKYVNALTKQLKLSSSISAHEPGSSSSTVILQPPTNLKHLVARQGPFLLQPAPPELEASLEDPEATDILYMEVGVDARARKPVDENGSERSEKLGVVAVVYRDGKVDLCLDIEKIEARWDIHPASTTKSGLPTDLPSFTVFESVDLGLLSALQSSSPESPSNLLPFLELNSPKLRVDPLYPGRLYVCHAFGVHAIDTSDWMKTLFSTMQDEVTANVIDGVKELKGSEVVHILNTFSPENRTTAPVVGLTIVDNAFIGYSLLAVTSQYQAVPIALTLRPEPSESLRASEPPITQSSTIAEPSFGSSSQNPASRPSNQRAYVSLLSAQEYQIPAAFTSRRSTTASISAPPLVSRPSFSSPPSTSSPFSVRGTPEQPITPAILRSFGQRVESLRADIRDVSAGVNTVQARIDLQHKEMKRQLLKLAELEEMIAGALASAAGDPKGKAVDHGFGGSAGTSTLRDRVKGIVQVQQDLVTRLDKVLQRLMDSYSPNLSEMETQWFSELGRMKREVGAKPAAPDQRDVADDGEEDGWSLWARAELLKHHLNILKPQLEEINKKEKEKEKKRAGGPRRSIAGVSGIGSAQLRSVQRRLAQETKILEATKSQAEELTAWLDERQIANS